MIVRSISCSSDPCGAALAAGHDLQMLERDRIDDEAVAARAVRDGADVGEVGLLRVAQVGDEAAGGLNRRRAPFEPEPFEAVRLELVEQRAPRGLRLETPALSRRDRRLDAGQRHDALDDRSASAGRSSTTISRGRSTAISSASACKPCRAVILRGAELAGGEVDQRRAEDGVARSGRGNRHEERRLARFEITGVGQRSRRDDAHDFAPDEPLGLLRVLDLLADGDAEALPDEPRDVAVGRMERHAAHRECRCRRRPSIATSASARAPAPRPARPRRTSRRSRPSGRTRWRRGTDAWRRGTDASRAWRWRWSMARALGSRLWAMVRAESPSREPTWHYYPSMVDPGPRHHDTDGQLCARRRRRGPARRGERASRFHRPTRLPGDLMTLLEHGSIDAGDVDVFAVATGPGRSPGFASGSRRCRDWRLRRGSRWSACRRSTRSAGCADAEAAGRRIATWVDAWRGEVYAALYEGEREVEPPSSPTRTSAERLGARRRSSSAMARGHIRTKIRGALGDAGRFASLPTPLLAGAIALLAGALASEGAYCAAPCDPAAVRAPDRCRTRQGLACSRDPTPEYWIDRLDGDQDLDGVLVVESESFTNPWTREMYAWELQNRAVCHIWSFERRVSRRRLLCVLARRRRDPHQQRRDPAAAPQAGHRHGIDDTASSPKPAGLGRGGRRSRCGRRMTGPAGCTNGSGFMRRGRAATTTRTRSRTLSFCGVTVEQADRRDQS